MKAIINFLLVLGVLVLGGFIVIYSGIYNISMLNRDNPIINNILDYAMTRSVQHHSRAISSPLLLDTNMIRAGQDRYQELCIYCHGAPGVEAGKIAAGLWPDAPNLAVAVPDWNAPQLFWMVKNGIKFSSMPAWGPTNSDDQIWELVAYLEQLPALSKARQQNMERG